MPGQDSMKCSYRTLIEHADRGVPQWRGLEGEAFNLFIGTFEILIDSSSK